MSAKKKAKPAKKVAMKRARAAMKEQDLDVVAFLTECATPCGLHPAQLLVICQYLRELLGVRRGALALGGALWSLAEANGRIKAFEALANRRAAKP